MKCKRMVEGNIYRNAAIWRMLITWNGKAFQKTNQHSPFLHTETFIHTNTHFHSNIYSHITSYIHTVLSKKETVFFSSRTCKWQDRMSVICHVISSDHVIKINMTFWVGDPHYNWPLCQTLKICHVISPDYMIKETCNLSRGCPSSWVITLPNLMLIGLAEVVIWGYIFPCDIVWPHDQRDVWIDKYEPFNHSLTLPSLILRGLVEEEIKCFYFVTQRHVKIWSKGICDLGSASPSP